MWELSESPVTLPEGWFAGSIEGAEEEPDDSGPAAVGQP